MLPALFSGPCNSFYCLGHFKNVYDDDDDDIIDYTKLRHLFSEIRWRIDKSNPIQKVEYTDHSRLSI